MGLYNFNTKRVINVPVDQLFRTVSNYREWDCFEPWRIQEPETRLKYSDQLFGDGAWYSWDGEIIGAGRMETISEVKHKSINARLEFLRPMKSEADVYWLFDELEENKTEVIWGMRVNLPFFMRVFVKQFEKNLLADYNLGLDRLSAALDPGDRDFKISIIGETEQKPFDYAGLDFTGESEYLPEIVQEHYGRLKQEFDKQHIVTDGFPGIVYHNMNQRKETVSVTDFLTVKGVPVFPDEDINVGKIEEGRFFKVELRGDYPHLKQAWRVAFDGLKMRKIKFDHHRPCLEIYPTNPEEVQNPLDIITWILIPMKG